VKEDQIELRGFDELRRKISRLAQAAEKLDGEHQVTLDQMFHPLFMLENTSYGSIEEFFEASPFAVKSQEDFEAIDESAFDGYVRDKTRFQSWDEMKQVAVEEWMTKRFEEDAGL
jgi:hypothetical protein